MATKTLSVLMDDETHERLRKAAYETRWSMSRIAVQAIHRWLDERDAAGGGDGDHP